MNRANERIFALNRQKQEAKEGTLAEGSNCVTVSDAVIGMTVGCSVTVSCPDPVDVTIVANSFVRVSVALDTVLVADF